MRPIPLDELDGDDVFLVIHHAVEDTVQDVIALSKPGGKTVSMTGTIGPTVAGSHEIFNVLVVPWNNGRPYTTSSWIDDKALTFEVCNLSLSAPYPVAQEAKQRLAEIAAAMHVEYGMPLNRWNICSHQEVYARGWDSYPTQCPGEDLQGSLDWIVRQAQLIVAGLAGLVGVRNAIMEAGDE